MKRGEQNLDEDMMLGLVCDAVGVEMKSSTGQHESAGVVCIPRQQFGNKVVTGFNGGRLVCGTP